MTHQLHHLLLEELKRKIPKKKDIARFLMEWLSIEKVAVYRRLRSEVPFSLQEASIIAKKLSISLDELIGVNLEKSRTFRIKLPEFVNPNDNDHQMFLDFIGFLKSISRMEITETGIVTNSLPQDLFSKFEILVKFNIFKWQYYYNYEKKTSFKDLVILQQMLDEFKIQFTLTKNFKTTHYIFDQRIFIRIIGEIEYFRSIRLIDNQSVKEIKEGLLLLIDYLDNITQTGNFPETGNKVYLYITDMDIPFSCTYIRANDIEYTLIKTYILTSITSFDKLVFKKTKDWVYSSIRTSTLITKSAETERINFFEKQRKLMDALCP